jgi:iron-sulfur cluster insertion protein
MITVTENATNKIEDLLAENQEPYLRISVNGGGCSGFQYAFAFEDVVAEDDFTFGKVIVDAMSMQYLQEASVDYVEDIMGASFRVQNPNAETTCGCGSSFSV